MLEKMSIPVQYSYHSNAPSQHGIDLRYCEALSAAFSALSRAISRSFAAMTSSFLSSWQVSSVYLLHRCRYGHFAGGILLLLAKALNECNAFVENGLLKLAPVFDRALQDFGVTGLNVHAALLAVPAEREYPRRMSLARFAGLAVLAVAPLVHKRKRSVRDWIQPPHDLDEIRFCGF
jgi:hypothetical protein